MGCIYICCSRGKIIVAPWQRFSRKVNDEDAEPKLIAAHGYRASLTLKQRRFRGSPCSSMKLAVVSLMDKKGLNIKIDEKAHILRAFLPSAVRKKPVASTQPSLLQWARDKWSPPELVPEGKLRHVFRNSDGRLRMCLSQKGSKRIWSNWHKSKQEAYDLILNKIAERKSPGKKPTGNAPARSQQICDVQGVMLVHQIFGLYRDGAEMPPLYKMSSYAWQAYCRRQGGTYILWTAEMIDTVMQKYAPHTILELYKSVKHLIQQVDIARFFLLYLYGGLYADLDVFPNRDMYPQVTFGLCKMPSRAENTQDEWEIEMVIATRGNPNILKLIEYMAKSIDERRNWPYYVDKPCRFIYHTTGPKIVKKFLKHTRLQRSLTFYTMCRPIEEQSKLVINAAGIITGFPPTLQKYDVLSTFSMSYVGQAEVEGLTLCSPVAQLPPFPQVVYPALYRRLKRKAPSHCRPRITEPPEEHSIAQDLLRQPVKVNHNNWAVGAESDSSDESQGLGYQFLAGINDRQEAERELPATKGHQQPAKRRRSERSVTTPEAIGRLINRCR